MLPIRPIKRAKMPGLLLPVAGAPEWLDGPASEVLKLPYINIQGVTIQRWCRGYIVGRRQYEVEMHLFVRQDAQLLEPRPVLNPHVPFILGDAYVTLTWQRISGKEEFGALSLEGAWTCDEVCAMVALCTKEGTRGAGLAAPATSLDASDQASAPLQARLATLRELCLRMNDVYRGPLLPTQYEDALYAAVAQAPRARKGKKNGHA